jgi:ABC-type dipeptide/oligopeptide/nickel transport system permease component
MERMTVLKLIGRRLLAAIPILLVVSALLFCALRVLPVDPAAMSLPPTATIAEVEAKRREMGLDRPLPARCAVILAHPSICAARPDLWWRQPCLRRSSSQSGRW